MAALSNLAANLALIPVFGIRGAAVATIISQLFSNSLFWIKMKGVVPFRVLPLLKKIGLATVIMAAVVYFLKVTDTNVFSNIFVSAAVYGTTLYVLREKRFLELGKVFKNN